jgi:predicted HTH transcriptional regulator
MPGKQNPLLRSLSAGGCVKKMRDGFVTVIYRKQGLALEKINNGEKVGEKVGERITENQKLILGHISENPYTSSAELSVIVGISSRKIETNISKLKAKGLLERIGSAKGGYWKVKK